MTQPPRELCDLFNLADAPRHRTHLAFLLSHPREDVRWKSLPTSPYLPGEHLPTAFTLDLARLVRPALQVRLLGLGEELRRVWEVQTGVVRSVALGDSFVLRF